MWWLAGWIAAQSPVGVAVDPASALTSEAASHLTDELDAPVVVRTSTAAFSDILVGRHPDWPEALLVLFDPERRRIAAVRPEDGTVMLRVLAPTGPASAYAMAVAGAEMIRILRQPPPPRAPAAPPSAPTPMRIGLVMGLGIDGSESFGHEPAVVQPRLLLGGELWSIADGLVSRFSVGLRAPLAASTRDDVRYQRWGPSILLSLGHRWDRFTVGGLVETGVSFTQAQAIAGDGTVEGSDRRAPVWVTVGPTMEMALLAGLALTAELNLGWSASPADYLVRGERLLAEGRFRWGGNLSVIWRWNPE